MSFAAVFPGQGSQSLGMLGELAAAHPEVQQTFAEVQPPDVTVVNGRVTVHMSGDVKVPFGRVLSLLDPERADARVPVAVSATAESPITAPGGC